METNYEKVIAPAAKKEAGLCGTLVHTVAKGRAAKSQRGRNDRNWLRAPATVLNIEPCNGDSQQQ